MNLLESYIRKVVREALNETRGLGTKLSDKTNNPYITVYRAVKSGVDSFYDKDFVTLSKKFAIEHAENNHIVYSEPHQVIRALISTDKIYDAPNPGEYFYSGPDKPGKAIYITRGEDYEGWDDSLLGENVGPGINDNRSVSDIVADMANRKFQSPDFIDDYDPDNGIFLYDDEYDDKLDKELPDHEFDGLSKGYSNLKNKQNWKNPSRNKRI